LALQQIRNGKQHQLAFGRLDDFAEVGAQAIHLRDGGMDETGKDAHVMLLRREDIGDAKHDDAFIPIEFEVADVQLLVRPHDELCDRESMRLGNNEGSTSDHAGDVGCAINLNVQRHLAMMGLKVGLDDLHVGDFAIDPALGFEGGEGGSEKF